ncbi:hypothetical protein ACFOGJ_18075 [Marinibaculum pumilum]|uniref:MORN repeat-containing protein n=1 Tax=Marinibaculum pumilum TaxID=1766165 RepID=A0ABV7L3L8_9PROT
MERLWTWSGRSFGYRDGDNLWTQDGRHVGRFKGDEVYGPDGRYLGELKNDNRLIRNRSKHCLRRSGFFPSGRRMEGLSYANYVGYVMYAGYEDFPAL